MSPLLHFFDMQNVFSRFRGVPGKIIYFNSWFRLKIIVVGRYTTSPDCPFTDSFTYILDLPKIWIKKIRSSRQEVFCKKGVLRNFAKFTGKHLCQSLFLNKVAGLRSATLLKKKLWHRRLPVKFAKFLRTPFLQNTSWRLLLNNYSLSILTFLIFLSLIYIEQIIFDVTMKNYIKWSRIQV